VLVAVVGCSQATKDGGPEVMEKKFPGKGAVTKP